MNAIVQRIHELCRRLDRPIRLMEVCGTHTMAAFRSGLRSLLPDNLHLLSGPGCPVCVTPIEYLDAAIALAEEPNTVVATYGDMLRVPGSNGSLELARARGAQVRTVYSATDALELARNHPQFRVVFLAVGFETTAPATAWVVKKAHGAARNFYVLCGHKRIPPAMMALLEDADGARLDGFLCPGHVSAILGAAAFEPIAERFHRPCVVAGFEGADMAQAIEMLLRQLLEGRADVEIQYTRAVNRAGNARALAAIEEVFTPCSAQWRGLGAIPESGLTLKPEFQEYDAAQWLEDVPLPPAREPRGCRCGDVLRGVLMPPECPLFGTACTPAQPAGPCMVSSEGTCAAYFRYRGDVGL